MKKSDPILKLILLRHPRSLFSLPLSRLLLIRRPLSGYGIFRLPPTWCILCIYDSYKSLMRGQGSALSKIIRNR